jgi:hypothetical protein
VIRRFALAACAVVAATSLSACSTFSQNDAAAKVGQVEISQSQVEEIVGWVIDNKATLQLDIPDLGPGLGDGELTRTVVRVLVQNEVFRQSLAAADSLPTAEMLATADTNVIADITGPTREMLVQNDALTQAINALDDAKRPAVIDSFSQQHVFVDARYGAWDSLTGMLAPMG